MSRRQTGQILAYLYKLDIEVMESDSSQVLRLSIQHV